jgi:hypothetical protein
MRAISKKGATLGGQARQASMTAKQRTALGKKAAAAKLKSTTKAQRIAQAKKAAAARYAKNAGGAK